MTDEAMHHQFGDRDLHPVNLPRLDAVDTATETAAAIEDGVGEIVVDPSICFAVRAGYPPPRRRQRE